MLAILNKAEHDTENMRDLNLAMVKHMTVLVIVNWCCKLNYP
jgi:hypothetical protein